MTKTMDYFFSIGLPWAYIGLEAFETLASEHRAESRAAPTGRRT